jgi:hypothetical protein
LDIARITPGEWLAALSGFVFLLSMFFLDWFSAASAGGGELDGWASFGFPLDVLLFIGGLLGIGHAVLRAAGVIPGQPPAPRGQAVVSAGAVLAVLVLVRLIAPPGDTDAELGAFIALLAALGIGGGGLLAIREHASGKAP